MSPSLKAALPTIAVYGAAALAIYFIAKNGAQLGRTLGRGAADGAAGVVKGIGDSIGLPDPADERTLAQGRAALARGDYLEASLKLPAAEFLRGVASRATGSSSVTVRDDYVGDFDTVEYRQVVGAASYDGDFFSRLPIP